MKTTKPSTNKGGSSIKSKIVLIVIVIFAFFIIVSLMFSTYTLETRGQKEIAEYRISEVERTQEALKSYVHIAYTAVENNYKNATDVNYLSDYYGDRLRNLIDLAEVIVDDLSSAVKKGKLSKPQAQAQAIKQIKRMRYNKGVGYYFIFTNEKPYPKMILEPKHPEMEGTILDNKKYNNAGGTNKNLFVSAIEKLADNNEAFIDYIWPRSDEANEGVDIAKFSYLRRFDEWGWIIGTGIYLDDAIKDCIKKSKSDLREMRYANGSGYYWINDNTKPTPRLIMNPFIPQLEGQILTDKKYNRAFGEDYNLYEAFLSVSEEQGDGFVDYNWDKPIKGGIIEDAPKTSYVKFFKPLGWVIGSGVYIDDIDKEIDAKSNKMREQRNELIISYLLISLTLAGISIGILIFFMNRYFRADASKRITNDTQTDNTKADTTEKNETSDDVEKISTEQAETNQNNEQSPKVNATDDEANNLVGMILREHTKQITVSRLAEGELRNKTDSEIRELTNEVKQLIEAVRNPKD